MKNPVLKNYEEERGRILLSEWQFDLVQAKKDTKKKAAKHVAAEDQDSAFIISELNQVKKSWDIFILLLALVVSFTVPLEIAFVEL